ncbi:MAG: cobaltochelatase subunit CobN [Methanobrevibacter arboriphilus]|nr:cobaltochelatase subunit CobN [Methanobrevibacter arboriphilus]
MALKFKKIALITLLSIIISLIFINIAFAAPGYVNVEVKDSYNSTSGNYSENGFAVKNATVKIIDKTNKVVLSGKTDDKGKCQLSVNTLSSGNYILNISYSTYLTYSMNLTINSDKNNHNIPYRFTPDIAFVCYYPGHKEKVDNLMKISSRIYYIDSMNFNQEKDQKVWLLRYANFIYLDMFAEGQYEFDQYLFLNTPANKNYKIAYCFGDYTPSQLAKFGFNFIGANFSNNTPHTVENTFIGSYFKSQSSENMNQDILSKNMQNLFDYIRYLLGETNLNPTDDDSKTPILDSLWGIYHPDYGVWEFKVNQSEVAKWIRQNPGYTCNVSDGSNNDSSNTTNSGDLRWMSKEYNEWVSNQNVSSLYSQFENWYKSKKQNITSNFITIASYRPGGVLVDALIRAYESQGRATFNVFQIESAPSMASILLNLSNTLSRKIVAINSLYSWSMDYKNMGENGGAIDEYIGIDVEIIRALNDISEMSYLSDYGPQSEWTYSVTIPSMEGVFGAIAVSYVDASGKTQVIKAGVDKLVETTQGWANLKEKSNEYKKIAVILYNYPPGKAEIGASYLDVFQSVHDLLEQLYDAGYNIGMNKSEIPTVAKLVALIQDMGNKGTYAQGLLNEYVEKNWDTLMKYGQLVDENKVNEYLNSLGEVLKEQLLKKWGQNGTMGSIMVYTNNTTHKKYIVIPGAMFGNVFLTFQPSRGWEEVENYHDLNLPPHQQYVTFYKWLGDVFKADAMIHMGTHGTLEFLPGRSLGLQDDDWTFVLSGIPNIYPYIVSNPGEASVAKNRAGALVISHMTPASVISQLYGNYTELNTLIDKYEESMQNNVTNLAETYKKQILNLSKSLNIDQPSKTQSFEDWLEDVHHLLEGLDNDIITLGLHTLGYVLTGNEMIQGVITIVSSKTTIYDHIKDLLYPNLKNVKYTDLVNGNNSVRNATKVQTIQNWLNNFVKGLLNGSITNITKFAENNNISNSSDSYEDFYEALVLCNTTIRDIQNNLEWESILKALSGEYVVPGLCVDPAYGDSLPTGRNVYFTDTTKMPSKAAYETAKNIVDKLIVEYYESHNKTFPELVGLVIWGTELLRTEGIGLAEFLYFLGVTPVWTSNGVAKGVELIPLENLTVTLSNGKTINRPRIDVYTSAVTSNSNWIKLMVSAVNLAYNASNEKDSENYVRKHYKQYPSLDRIFGLPGAILEGTGMSNFIPNTNKWQNNTNISATLADIYLSRVSYSWSIDSKGNIVVTSNRGAYEFLLKKTNLITQNVDSTWRFLDSDDYYDWFGGLLGASQYLGGKPDTAIVDIRNKNNIITRNLQDQLDFELRSTILNPIYRDALLGTAAGWNFYASKYQYVFGFNTVASGYDGGNLISSGSWISLGYNLLDPAFNVDAAHKAYSFQSMSGWVLVAAQKGMWSGDNKLLTELADRYIDSVIQYGVACCHHTCANLDFNKWVLQISSKSNADKKKYSDILQKATLGGAAYSSSNGGSSGGSSSSGSSSGSSGAGSDIGELSQDSSSSGEVGDSSSSKASSSSSVSTSGASDNSQGASGDNNGKVSELSSDQSSSSSSDSSISAAFIAVVLAIIALFVVGYIKNKKNEDY